jgi:type II secretory pathway pseudopilin PulG
LFLTKLKENNGFSIIELLVVLNILFIVLGSFYWMVSYSLEFAQDSQKNNIELLNLIETKTLNTKIQEAQSASIIISEDRIEYDNIHGDKLAFKLDTNKEKIVLEKFDGSSWQRQEEIGKNIKSFTINKPSSNMVEIIIGFVQLDINKEIKTNINILN